MSIAVALLTGPRAPEILQAALTGRPDGRVPGFQYTVDRVHDRAGSETSVTYHVSHESDRLPVSDYLVATTADVAAGSTVEIDGVRIQVWRHPADPLLPGLAGACTSEVLAEWLPALDGPPRAQDVDTTDDAAGAADRDMVTDMLVYRPLRRAVLRTTCGPHVFFTKVVRPKFGELMERRHELLAGLGPDVVSCPEPGVLVTSQVPGAPLAVALSAWQLGESTVRPQPGEALALLDRLPQEVMSLPVRQSWTDRVDFYRDMAAAALPDHAQEIERLAGEIGALATRFPTGPIVATHGDFHDGNVFCEEGRLTRMIDIDNVGPGRREDDLACMVAHLSVLPSLSPAHYPRGTEVTDAWAAAFEEVVHPGALRARVAGVLLSLVSGSDRATALTRLDLARSWTWRASAAQ